MTLFMIGTMAIMPPLTSIWAWYIWGKTSPRNKQKEVHGQYSTIPKDVFDAIVKDTEK